MPTSEFRSGFVALLGRPNAGKSTLLNRLLGQKIAIVSPKPQTTRTRILGVINEPQGQLALVDTPGLHQAKSPLNKYMVEAALAAAADADLIAFLVEVWVDKKESPPKIDDGNKYVLEQLKKLKKPVVLVLNKVDTIKRQFVLPWIELYRKAYDFKAVVPISAMKGENVDGLVEELFKQLPAGEQLFPEDVFTDQTERDIVAELIREQVLRHCREEIPYSCAVVIEVFDESDREAQPEKKRKGLVRIHANVFVERDSQKAIVVGKQGSMLKQIGTDARQPIERLLGAKVFLSLQVKVEPRWSERADTLREFGYDNRLRR